MTRLLAPLLCLACTSPDPISEWPEGSYCVLRPRGDCPRAANGDFLPGTIVIDTDDLSGDLSQSNEAGASTAGGGQHARLELCCGDFGPSSAAFPPDSYAIVAGGSYADPLCPSGFAHGNVFIDAEDDELIGEDASSYVEGSVGASSIVTGGNVEIHVCESSPASDGIWPEGRFCVFAGDGETCPAEFRDGPVVTDDEDEGNIDALTGEVGGIWQEGSTTYFPVCCT
jgi:hypothetical protein